MKVFAEGHVPLTTQMYFDQDPHLDLDPIADKRLAVTVHNAVARKALTCTFNIALPQLSKAAYRRR